MTPLYEYTLREVTDLIISDYSESRGVTRKEARTLLINALLYNCVTDEVTGQMDYLRDPDSFYND